MIVYFNGRFVRKEEVCISPDDRGFLFADGVYEVICAFDGCYFQAEAHFDRLARSLEGLHILSPDLEGLRRAAEALLVRNELTSGGASLYIQITRGVADRGHTFPETPPTPTVYAAVTSYTPPEHLWRTGVKAILIPDIRWARCDIKSLALIPNVLASQRAKDAGAYDAIQVRDGAVTEGSHTSVCVVFGGVLFTHPLTHHILGGVTRDVVLGLCRELGIPYVERPVLEEALRQADEVMFLGTSTGVMPIVEIDGRPVGAGAPGSVTMRLQAALWTMMQSAGGAGS